MESDRTALSLNLDFNNSSENHQRCNFNVSGRKILSIMRIK